MPLGDLLGVDGSEFGRFPPWVMALMVVLFLVIFALAGVYFCMKQQALCFQGAATEKDNYKQQVSSDSYSDDMRRGLYGSATSEVMRTPPITDQLYMSREAVV